jgi:hypothetical protein
VEKAVVPAARYQNSQAGAVHAYQDAVHCEIFTESDGSTRTAARAMNRDSNCALGSCSSPTEQPAAMPTVDSS